VIDTRAFFYVLLHRLSLRRKLTTSFPFALIG
jgi:hypothetical protein